MTVVDRNMMGSVAVESDNAEVAEEAGPGVCLRPTAAKLLTVLSNLHTDH